MKTDELREKYLAFFQKKGCVRRPSDVLVPRDDPTVLFTPAGMNQFKDQFLGVGKLDFTRATTCQKCLRTGDISNVGVTAYHHTFFEMLGNFSFGDYFKREAILWAWEFLTQKKWLGLDPERLTVSVYQGTHGADDEAFEIWRDEVGLPVKRIARLDEDENFWPASAPSEGPDGVCGPCSEIFYHPPEGGKEVEIWNLVFTQFNRVGDPPDNLRPLPSKNIDTGMGLERTAAVLQGKVSNFEIDILRPLCEAAGDVVGRRYKFDAEHGRPLRRIADHARAVTFCIHEGVEPGNNKESYVVRQLLRRAVLEGYLLGKDEPFLYELVPAVVDAMKGPYPELAQTVDSVSNMIREEEAEFLTTVERGVRKFDRIVEGLQSSGGSTISGDDAFDLHQQDGFLIELTQSMAARHNLSIDMSRFNERAADHEDVSKGGKTYAVMAEGPLDALRKTRGGTEFLGYEATDADAEIVGLVAQGQLVDRLDGVGRDDKIAVVLDRTPFYGEAGGQVGDVGVIRGEGCEFKVTDTQRHGDLLLHLGRVTSGQFEVGTSVRAEVDAERRAGIRRAHSATHLLHHALRRTLGDKATQRGSKVDRDELRFDFAYRGPMTGDEIREVEDEINARIAEGSAVTTEMMNLEDARTAGAMALFGEKYPDRVRVVRMGDYSTELCGGTHLETTGQVGVCRVVSEEPVAKGVRRVVALTGPRALGQIRETEQVVSELAALLKTQPAELPRRVTALQDEVRELKRELQQQTSRSVAGSLDELIADAEVVAGVKIVTHLIVGGNRDTLRSFVDQLRQKAAPVAILLGAVTDGKVALTASVTRDLLDRGVKANECINAAARIVGGGGGGRPDMAEAGGKNPDKLPDALKEGARFYREKLEGA